VTEFAPIQAQARQKSRRHAGEGHPMIVSPQVASGPPKANVQAPAFDPTQVIPDSRGLPPRNQRGGTVNGLSGRQGGQNPIIRSPDGHFETRK